MSRPIKLMTLLRRIKCLLTRHHWLLVKTLPIGMRDDHIYIYRYECQICHKILNQKVRDLDEANLTNKEL